jgi:LmbE family N-acetylglucosaminyl deacetylase
MMTIRKSMTKAKLPYPFLIILFASVFHTARAQTVYTSGSQILKKLEKLNTTATVLYVAAHPDDENTRLLTYLANERNFRTVYISLTRGDGGQNLIGNEQGVALGIIRTQELLAARSVDGAEQTFGECFDFGYSKTPEETFQYWDKEKALSHLVWTIRKYRPDVIINRFPTTGEGGHGHHTASAILAVEAFRAAADPERFKEQLQFVQPWQSKRIFLNSFSSRNQAANAFEGQLQIDVGGYDVSTGRSHGETASESRSMHKSQGFGVARQRGALVEYFKKLDGDTSVNDVFENIPTTWDRVKGGSKIKSAIDKIIREYDLKNPSKSIPSLTRLLTMVRECDDDYWKSVKEQELIEIIKNCAGLYFEASTSSHKTTPGDTVGVTFTILSRLSDQIRLSKVACNGFDTLPGKTLNRNEVFSFKKVLNTDPNSGYSNVYWLEPNYKSTFSWPNSGLSWGEDLMQAYFTFEILGETLSFKVPFAHKWVDPVKGECKRPFEIVPLISVEPESKVALSINGKPTLIRVSVTAERDGLQGTLKLEMPSGWTSTPSTIDMKSLERGKPSYAEFTLNPPAPADMLNQSDNQVKAVFTVNGDRYSKTVKRIVYDHIPAVVYLEDANIRITPVSFESKARKIGYIEGAGDDVAKCLKNAGFDVDVLDGKMITKGDLNAYDAIITGIRAYNTIDDIGLWQDYLVKYVDNGGTLVVQYNTNSFFGTLKTPIGPYPFKVTRDRVTEEGAKPTFVVADHPLLNKPNKITADDFNGWVQERGLYFAGETSPEYVKPISWNDQGEKPLDGGLIYAKKGKGHFIYTGISFFRQLPAGVPGAYRLLINLINVE